MKGKEIRAKKISELLKELEDKRKNLEKLKFDLVTKKVKNHQEIKNTRRDIARILTIISEKRFLAENKGE